MASKPKISLDITEKDFGMGKILREAAKIRKKPYVKAGVTQKKGSRVQEGGKKTVAYIASVHEYGNDEAGIPERSFIRSTVTANKNKYDNHISQLKDQVLDGSSDMTVEKALGLIGQEIASDIKATIRAKIAPALKAATIRRKNKAVIEKAKGKVRGFEAKKKLTKGDKGRLFAAQELIDTGGDSTPLIDTGQLINSLSYEVVKEGSSENGEDGSVAGSEAPGGSE